jgi:hypothetical protein
VGHSETFRRSHGIVASLLVIALALTCVGVPGLRRAWVAWRAGYPTAFRYPARCTTTVGPACTQAVVQALRHATQATTGAVIAVPPHWAQWTPPAQLLLWINLERIAFHHAPVMAIVPALQRAANQGAGHHQDPRLPGVPTVSVWAQAPSAPAAVFLWTFDDGYFSPNEACGPWNLAGCWAHRQALLVEAAPGGQLISGAAARITGPAQEWAWIAEAVAHGPAHPTITWRALRARYPVGERPVRFGPIPLSPGRVLWIWCSRLGLLVVLLGLMLRGAWQSGVLGIWFPRLWAWWSEP